MKQILTLLACILLSQAALLSQDSVPGIAHISSLPPAGIFLDRGWKFHPGDDTAWANPLFDDQGWKSVSLSRYEKDFLPAMKSKGIGWFRIRMSMDSAIRMNPAALLISQMGASDIYINGLLFLRLGQIHPGGKIQTNNPHEKPFLFQGSLTGDTATLAIRFASPPPLRPILVSGFNNLPLSVKIRPWSDAVNHFKTELVRPRLQVGYSFMCVGLGILFILLYTFLPKERINILFAGFCFFVAIVLGIEGQLKEGDLNMQAYGWFMVAFEFMSKACGMLILCIIAAEVLRKITVFQLALISYILLADTVLNIFFGETRFQFIANHLVRLIFVAELFRLFLISLRRKNYIIGVVALTSVALNLVFVLAEFTPINIARPYSFWNQFVSFVVILIYIASKYTRRSKSLVFQLAENQRLSAEKEQMLKAQNETLEKLVQERTTELRTSLEELKETQAQLIQSEKMASLGELTAGIAHEIQNPLNFVNNFSDLNTELIGEMQKELKEGDPAEAISIAQDIQQNLDKISFHGKRAEGIVKGMLLHSRANTDQKELTDINELADEYFRLAYHGLRAKDKFFNATMVQELDPQAGKIMIVAPDIGRVLLNLFNNAFYSVMEKKKKTPTGYEPKVYVLTKKFADKLEIRVKDNGLGISQKIRDKIFQPFFTNKPAGQGTGLGLSLSYDIVTKEHKGELKVNTQEGEYAEFIILLPLHS